jgi:hypothetical protein
LTFCVVGLAVVAKEISHETGNRAKTNNTTAFDTRSGWRRPTFARLATSRAMASCCPGSRGITTYLAYARDMRATRDRLVAGS